MEEVFIIGLLGSREDIVMGVKMGQRKSACGFGGRRYSQDREGFPGNRLLNLEEQTGGDLIMMT